MTRTENLAPLLVAAADDASSSTARRSCATPATSPRSAIVSMRARRRSICFPARSARRGRAARGGLECSSSSALAPDGSAVDGFEFDGRDGDATAASEPVDAGIRVALELRPTDDPQWLVPGIFYGENRAGGVHARLPALHARPRRRRADGVGRVVVPRRPLRDARRLRARRRADHERARARSASPASASRTATAGPLIWLDFPYREEPLRYDGSETPQPPDVQTHRWQPGESVELEFRQSDGDWRRALPADGTVPRTRPGSRWTRRPSSRRGGSTAGTSATTRRGSSRRSASTGDGVERDAMHVSWISGVPYAYALLRHGRRVGNDEYVRAAEAVLDHVAANLTPGRHVLAAVDARARLDVGLAPRPRARARAHARRRDAVHAPRRRTLGGAARSNVDVALPHAARRRRVARRAHLETGDAVSWEGTAGMSWIPALVEAGHLDEARARRRVLRAVRHVVRRARGRRPRADAPRTATRPSWRSSRSRTGRPRAVPPTGRSRFATRTTCSSSRHRPRPLRLQDTRRRQGVAAEPAPARVRADLPARADAARASR